MAEDQTQPVHYYDVVAEPHIGRLDERSYSESEIDLAAIRTYIRAEQQASKEAPGRAYPSIAREVLVAIWQTPRIGFHDTARRGLKGFQLRNKLLLVPWSVEAFERWQSTGEVKDLVTEHVTPIDALWRKLKDLQVDPDDPDTLQTDEEWNTQALAYLNSHFMVAVLTKEQAKAIDKVPGLQKKGTEGNPFVRYRMAEEHMNKSRERGEPKPIFSVTRFVIPGPRSGSLT